MRTDLSPLDHGTGGVSPVYSTCKFLCPLQLPGVGPTPAGSAWRSGPCHMHLHHVPLHLGRPGMPEASALGGSEASQLSGGCGQTPQDSAPLAPVPRASALGGASCWLEPNFPGRSCSHTACVRTSHPFLAAGEKRCPQEGLAVVSLCAARQAVCSASRGRAQPCRAPRLLASTPGPLTACLEGGRRCGEHSSRAT